MLERCEKTWIDRLADRRRRKLWLGKGYGRRRRALSPGAIRDLRTLVSSNELYNDGLGRGKEVNVEVDQVECTEVERIERLNEVSEEGNTDKDKLRDKETDKFVSDNVVNISSRVLTQAEVSLLSKGLKFCPTPKELDWSPIKRDVKEFCRKIKCKDFFEDQANYGVDEFNQNFKQFKEKSSWVPSKVDPTIEVYCSKLEERILAINTGG